MLNSSNSSGVNPSQAVIEFEENAPPFAPVYQDVYHSDAGALAQAQHVFLSGNDLPVRWRGRERFVIVETGFGLGMNFLATRVAWEQDLHGPTRLHYVALEKHPVELDDLNKVHQAWTRRWEAGRDSDVGKERFAALSAELRAQWPALPQPWSGMRRLDFASGRVLLTLWLGDALAGLRQMQLAADAFYLDGFSPAKNPEMWSPQLCKALSRLAAPQATLATWCVAGSVHSALNDAGFELGKAQGLGKKRHMLRGVLRERRPRIQTPAPQARTVLVIGAGLAGAATAERLTERGWCVQLLEQASGPAAMASGNLAGIVRPHPSVDDNTLARLSRAGFFTLKRQLQRLAANGFKVRHAYCGVRHLARNEAHAARLKRMAAEQRSPLFYWEAPGKRAYGNPAHGALVFPGAGWVAPGSLVTSCLEQATANAENAAKAEKSSGSHFSCCYNCEVSSLVWQNGEWQATAADGKLLGAAPHLIIANGAAASRFEQTGILPQRAVRGQVTHLPVSSVALGELDSILCGPGYLIPNVGTPGKAEYHLLGATHIDDDGDTRLRQSEQQDNLARLADLLPGAPQARLEALSGRVGLRPQSPDKLPMVGAVPGQVAGLWCLLGFGSRGIVWSALMAEILACLMEGEPLPVENRLRRAIDPARFERRKRRL